MQFFKDSNGRDWSFEIGLSARRDIRKATGNAVDVFAAIDGTAQQALADPDNLFKTLWALCGPEAAKRSIAEADFEKSLDGDALQRASDALIEAIADFFPEAQRKMLRKMIKVANGLQAKAAEEIDKIDPAEIVSKMLSKQSSNSPESVDAIPIAEASES